MIPFFVYYFRFINCVSSARQESAIRATTSIVLTNPDILSLGAGWPNPNLFPFQSAQFVTNDGFQLTLAGDEMKKALQYSATKGIPSLVDWVTNLHKKYHNPPIMKDANAEESFDVCVTSGSQDGLSKVFEMLAKRGDSILLDNPCYTGTLAMLRPYGYNLVPIDTDKFGMRSDLLLKYMQQWSPDDASDPQSDIPKLIYTIPTCGNPTGVSASLERKKEIYKIAQKYDMLIVEDDPYFFIQFGDVIPSYQSIDTDGRVLRSDSMSKVMSSGLRIGWLSGAAPFIKRIALHQQTTVMHSSTFGQAMVSALFEKWGIDGFEAHIKRVQGFYQSRRDLMVKCLEKHLTGLAEWNNPEGGMFVWIKLKGIEDTTALIQKRALDKKIILIPGSVFEVEEGKRSSYCRASYSFATEDVMNEVLRRLAELIREETQIKS